jgi:hypothetical protein
MGNEEIKKNTSRSEPIDRESHSIWRTGVNLRGTRERHRFVSLARKQ